ncbi:biotin--[acetyl-CoA-carboxylase] ligase [Nakamurella sp. YIM 132087]|uniref:biotin--[biotin carboxyl-carrier protein] ligase n=1 Tax=Nakamurella alba TaxID=2665158 RepID=A0A7K1FJ48_9ACTN|nr:biotin--[acetyl-CoA-carboxylase] ligase [Nakamurella alba]MTD14161.1 biotin--[acetyl-CoA-carboxylase] ligase [Nakamurella alba]
MQDERQPLEVERTRELLAQAGIDRRVALTHALRTGSTNADLAAPTGSAAAAHTPFTVLTTEEQVAGRGRSGRTWSCPPGAGLMFSVRADRGRIPAERIGWIGAVLGLAILDAVRPLLPDLRPVTLKWPNDVLVGPRKLAGILAEMGPAGVVVGSGINISLRTDELPRDDATSLRLAGAGPVDRAALLAAILGSFVARFDRWEAAGGDVDAAGVRGDYRAVCSTLGTDVRVQLPGGSSVTGQAEDVDPDGGIVLRTPDGAHTTYRAGDVVHLRPADTLPG